MAQAALELEPATRLRFFVAGKPQTAGSKTAVPMGKRYGVIEAGDAKSRAAKKAWRGDLRAAAGQAAEAVGFSPVDLEGAVSLTVVIVRSRPSAHLRTGRHAGQLKDWAIPLRPVARPDTVKLVRAAEDALTGVLWHDDSQIVDHVLFKVFGDQVGATARTEGMILEVTSAAPYTGPTLDLPTLRGGS